MSVAYPTINGVAYDYSSIEISLAGDVTRGVKDISYKPKLKPGKARGTSAQVLARTRGEGDFDGSLTMLRAEWDIFAQKLGQNYMEVPFDVSVVYADTGQPTTKDDLVSCRITDLDITAKVGADPVEVKLTLHMMRITMNGLDAFRMLS